MCLCVVLCVAIHIGVVLSTFICAWDVQVCVLSVWVPLMIVWCLWVRVYMPSSLALWTRQPRVQRKSRLLAYPLPGRHSPVTCDRAYRDDITREATVPQCPQ